MQIAHAEALARIEAEQRAQAARIDTLTTQQQCNSTKLGDIHEAIVGDGDKPGLSGRVRDLEGSEARRVWFLRMLTAAVVGLLAKLVLTGH